MYVTSDDTSAQKLRDAAGYAGSTKEHKQGLWSKEKGAAGLHSIEWRDRRCVSMVRQGSCKVGDARTESDQLLEGDEDRGAVYSNHVHDVGQQHSSEAPS